MPVLVFVFVMVVKNAVDAPCCRGDITPEMFDKRKGVKRLHVSVSCPSCSSWAVVYLLVAGKSTATDRSNPARRVLPPSTSFLTNVLLNVLVGLGSAYASGEVATGVFFEFQGSDYSRTG